MSSETEKESSEPEAIESLDSGRAWYHNKVLFLGIAAVVPVLAFVVIYNMADSYQNPSAQQDDAPATSPIEPAELVPDQGGGGLTAPLVNDDVSAFPIDLSQIETPTPQPQQPVEPSIEPLPTLEPVTTSTGGIPGLLQSGRSPIPSQTALAEDTWGSRVAEYEESTRFDAMTAPTPAEAGGGAWGAYYTAVSAKLADDAVIEAASSLADAVQPPLPTKFRLLRGTAIPAVVERAARSDASEVPLTALVVRDVLDARDSTMVAIPRGSRLVGTQAGITWNRIKGFWQAVQFPNGESVQISAALAAADGGGGVKGALHTGTLRRIGMGTIAAAIGAAASIGADEPQLVQVPASLGGDGQQPRVIPVESYENRARRELGRQTAELVRAEVEMMADRHIPYVDVSAGKTVFAVLMEDLNY